MAAGVSLAQAALARHHSYTLLSRLLLEGITLDLLPYVQKVAELAERLPSPYDADEAAAIHYHIFGFNVFAYESLFLAAGMPDEGAGKAGGAQLDGDVANRVAQAYEQAGYRTVINDISPDHVGYELELMAFLCGAEADAWEDGLPAVASQVQARQKAFLQAHLLRWLPALNEAIRRQGQPFYCAVADLLDELVYDHALALSVPEPAADWLPPPLQLLASQKTGVKQITHYLTTPALSGLYLSRNTLANLARRLELPCGFGSRQQLLENLMRTATQYDATDALLNALAAFAESWIEMYERVAPLPLDGFVRPWRQRARSTRHLLQEMAAQVQSNLA